MAGLFRIWFVAALVVMAAVTAWAFPPVPAESVQCIGVTRGQSFSEGFVFVNGKYIEPPYVVERWGTGIRINSIPVSGQIVDWKDFLKTQKGVRVVRSGMEASADHAVQKSSNEAASAVSSLDDLFDDDPMPAKAAKTSAARSQSQTSEASRPRETVSYELDGKFEPNETTKALLARVNESRKEIDRQLRAGGFVFFGDGYSWVMGDKRVLQTMLDKLPELLQESKDFKEFLSGVRKSNLVFLSEIMCEGLFENRRDYRKLKSRRARLTQSQKWDHVLEGVSDPLF